MITTPARPIRLSQNRTDVTPSDSHKSPRQINAACISTTNKNMTTTLTSPSLTLISTPIENPEQDKKTAAKKKVVSNVAIMAELMNFRDHMTKQLFLKTLNSMT